MFLLIKITKSLKLENLTNLNFMYKSQNLINYEEVVKGKKRIKIKKSVLFD